MSSSLLDRGWELARLPEVALELDLPEAASWKALGGSSWTRLQHASGESLLELRVTRAERLVRPSDCEARARLERPELPPHSEEEVVERHAVAVPRGYHGELVVSVREVSPGVLRGDATTFGADVGRCATVHFTTTARGDGREEEVGRRLSLVVTRVLPSVVALSADARVEAEPFSK